MQRLSEVKRHENYDIARDLHIRRVDFEFDQDKPSFFAAGLTIRKGHTLKDVAKVLHELADMMEKEADEGDEWRARG